MIEITKALIEFQKELPSIKTDAENKHLKQKYATRGAILKTILPILNKHGLALLFPTSVHDGGLRVSLTLHHTSGENINIGSIPYFDGEGDKNPEQAKGKSLTYSMRYLLNGLGVVTDEDADGTRERVPVAPPAPKQTIEDRRVACLKALSEHGIVVSDENLKKISECETEAELKSLYSKIASEAK